MTKLSKPIETKIESKVEVKSADKKIKSVHFIADAVVNYNLVKDIHFNNFDVSIIEDLVFFTDKTTKVQYMVPMSNIRTVVFL